jgi:1,4-dihydroxy-2-naphthoate octaprenyltransferase
VKDLVVHLRLHFQLLLAPVFLWGWLVSGGGFSARVLVAFVSFHLFLYAGATAFNSYYDRDVGPVGGLAHPPPVRHALLPFSLAIQCIGWALAALVNLPFFVIYGAFMGLSAGYSHPKIRWKGHTYTSVVIVGIGQGALAFLGAWAAARGDLATAVSLEGVVGALAAVGLILALYPLTQIYQVGEDRARGDRTLAVAWGPRGCFAMAIVLTVAGGLALDVVVWRLFGAVDATVIAVGLLAQLGLIVVLARHFQPAQVEVGYRQVMRLNTVSAGALGAYLLVRLASESR